MSHIAAAIYVHNADPERFLALVLGALDEQGYDLTDESAPVTQDVRRIAVHRHDHWVSLVEPHHPDKSRWAAAWASFLSLGLELPVLSLWSWDGEARIQLKHYAQGSLHGEVSLPKDARWGAERSIVLSLRELAACAPAARRTALGVDIELLDTVLADALADATADESQTEGAPVLYVPMNEALEEVATALGLPAEMMLAPVQGEPLENDIELVLTRRLTEATPQRE